MKEGRTTAGSRGGVEEIRWVEVKVVGRRAADRRRKRRHGRGQETRQTTNRVETLAPRTKQTFIIPL
jgi:hypothetical protein